VSDDDGADTAEAAGGEGAELGEAAGDGLLRIGLELGGGLGEGGDLVGNGGGEGGGSCVDGVGGAGRGGGWFGAHFGCCGRGREEGVVVGRFSLLVVVMAGFGVASERLNAARRRGWS
jgi:hypothetical protein